MNADYIRFATQTGGEKARRLLLSHGIQCTLRRNVKPNKAEGCSYAMYVHGNIQTALRLIEQARLPHLGIGNARDDP